jgi:cytochrome P450
MTAFRRDVLMAVTRVIRNYAEDMLEKVAARFRAGESPDLVPGFCRPLPAYVIAYMMGIPDDMMQTVVEWSDLMANSALGRLPDRLRQRPRLARRRARQERARRLSLRANRSSAQSSWRGSDQPDRALGGRPHLVGRSHDGQHEAAAVRRQ